MVNPETSDAAAFARSGGAAAAGASFRVPHSGQLWGLARRSYPHDGPATVRMLLCEAAWQAVRRRPSMKAFFERVTHGEPGRKKIALVAAAHRLARAMAAMLRTGEAWREDGHGQGHGQEPAA